MGRVSYSKETHLQWLEILAQHEPSRPEGEESFGPQELAILLDVIHIVNAPRSSPLSPSASVSLANAEALTAADAGNQYTTWRISVLGF